ncbi:type II toxin-antitoxin system RelE/ParE family toxin [Candidatus Acetothermia bacterium]|nr:type II toxin-antitoxin system RelE/ParE family toxin [Candidatus Acetothermia bacterium]
MSYTLSLSPHAQRELNRFHGKTYARLQSAIDKLASDPRPPGCLKLEGRSQEWRVRVGVYRIIYMIDDEVQQVEIRRVGHRREVYR